MSTFDEWLNYKFDWGTRKQILEEEVEPEQLASRVSWLRAAYDVGYQAGIESGNQADKLFGQS